MSTLVQVSNCTNGTNSGAEAPLFFEHQNLTNMRAELEALKGHGFSRAVRAQRTTGL
jgi:hypothetical protein